MTKEKLNTPDTKVYLNLIDSAYLDQVQLFRAQIDAFHSKSNDKYSRKSFTYQFGESCFYYFI